MNILVIDKEAKNEIKKVIDFAEAHRLNIEIIKKMVSGEITGAPFPQ